MSDEYLHHRRKHMYCDALSLDLISVLPSSEWSLNTALVPHVARLILVFRFREFGNPKIDVVTLTMLAETMQSGVGKARATE